MLILVLFPNSITLQYKKNPGVTACPVFLVVTTAE